MTHDALAVDCDRGDTVPEIDQRYTVLLLLRAQDGLGRHVRKEVFLGNGHAEVVEHLVDTVDAAAVADKDLEIARHLAAEGADHVVLGELDLVVRREGLRHGPVDDLALLILERIRLERDLLERFDLLVADVFVGVGAFERSFRHFLKDTVPGQSEDNLTDLDL